MESCEEIIRHPKIVLSEPKNPSSKMVFLNKGKHEVKKVLVDGCLIKKGKRCDFLVIDHKENEYFVELKGNKVNHAFEQLCETIQKLSQTKQRKNTFIICSRSPLASAEIQILQKKMKHRFNCILTVRSKSHEVKI